MNLLCLSSPGELILSGGVEAAVDVAGEVALEAATDLPEGAPFGGTALDVGAGSRVHSHAGDDGHVECSVEAPVATPVDPVPDGVAR